MKDGQNEHRPTNLFPLYLAAHATDIGLSGILLALPMLTEREFDTSAFQLAILWCLGAGMYLVCTPIVGWLAGRIGTGRLMLLGSSGMSITYLLLGLSRTMGQIYVVRLIMGIACAMFWPCLEAEIAHGAGSHQLRQRMGMFNLSWSTGSMVGFFLGGILFRLGHRLPFFCFAIWQLILAVILSHYGGLKLKAPAPPVVDDLPQTDNPDPDARGPRWMLLALIANFGTWSVASMTLGLFPDLATAQPLPNLNSVAVGVLWAVMGSFRTLTFLIFSRWHWWTERLGFFLGIQGLSFAALLIIFSQNSFYGLMPAFAMLGTAVGVTYFYSIFHSVHTAGNQALGAGIHEAVLGLGGLLVPLLAGRASDLVSEAEQPFLRMRIPYVVGAGVVILCLLVQFALLVTWHRKRAGREEADR